MFCSGRQHQIMFFFLFWHQHGFCFVPVSLILFFSPFPASTTWMASTSWCLFCCCFSFCQQHSVRLFWHEQHCFCLFRQSWEKSNWKFRPNFSNFFGLAWFCKERRGEVAWLWEVKSIFTCQGHISQVKTRAGSEWVTAWQGKAVIRLFSDRNITGIVVVPRNLNPFLQRL